MPAEQLQTLNRAITVLDCFTREHPQLGVREVARMTNLSTTTTGRLLAALKTVGILTQNPLTHAYAIGPRVLTWADIYNVTQDVRNLALPAIEELHEKTRETISLYLLDGDDRVCIERLESPQTVRITQRLGRRLPLYAGSAGKAMLAFLPEERRLAYLKRIALEPLTSSTITDPDVLKCELEEIRKQGSAVSYGEWISDAAGVAAPILDQNGAVIAGLSISGPRQRFTEENVPVYRAEVKRVAAQISESLGYNRG